MRREEFFPDVLLTVRQDTIQDGAGVSHQGHNLEVCEWFPAIEASPALTKL